MDAYNVTHTPKSYINYFRLTIDVDTLWNTSILTDDIITAGREYPVSQYSEKTFGLSLS